MTSRVTVLGVGNPIMGDDGIGLELLALLRAQRDDERVEFVDGGTSGMELVPVVEEASSLLILDAVAPHPASGRQPGQAVRIAGDQVPRLLASKLSPHQVGMLDVLAAARLLGREPERVEVVGIVPVDIDLRLGLSPAAAAGLPAAVALAGQVLDEWLS